MARWQFSDPWGQLDTLQREMNRLFDRWGGDGNRRAGIAGDFPAVNVWEEADTVTVEAELPGVSQDSLEIYVTGGNQLTIKGERRPSVPEKGVWHRQERGHGSFVRVLTLPFAVDRDKVEARLESGVLVVKLAKHEAARPRKIAVKSE
jgi:HSP20 family protein